MLIIYYANDGQIWDLSYWAQCQWHLWMGRHSWGVALQHMCVFLLPMTWVCLIGTTGERVCARLCWGCWNSIRQMGLFRVLSLLPKKEPICSSLLPTINMYSTYPFCLHSSIRLFFSAFASIGYSHWLKPECTWAPFTATKLTRETQQGCIAGFKREEKAWTFSARLLLQGLLCSAWQRKASRGADSRGLGGGRREQRWSTCTVALWGLAKSELCGF